VNRLARRILVGVLLIAVVLVAILLHPLLLAGLVAVWIFLASLEFTALLNRQGVNLPRLLLPALNLVFPVILVLELMVRHRSTATYHWQALLLPLAVVCLYVLVASEPRGAKLAYASFGILYLSFLPSHLILLRHVTLESIALGSAVMLFPLLATWINDTGAYGFGLWLGRQRLAPEISPNKTWEGFVAGLAVTVIFSVIYLGLFLPGSAPLSRIAIGVVLGVSAQVGDLIESIFKRRAGVKDSSSALSEHGGFLDRADSLLFTVPVFYYYLTFLLA
jgi:phosphatidate cytidylyltransferase